MYVHVPGVKMDRMYPSQGVYEKDEQEQVGPNGVQHFIQCRITKRLHIRAVSSLMHG